jgi:hypothetical protein
MESALWSMQDCGPVDLETQEKVDGWYVALHQHFKKMTKCEKGEKCIVVDLRPKDM